MKMREMNIIGIPPTLRHGERGMEVRMPISPSDVMRTIASLLVDMSDMIGKPIYEVLTDLSPYIAEARKRNEAPHA